MEDPDVDPTRLAISLLPLLSASHPSLDLPSLAAGLSVLPGPVALAVQGLGEEVKRRREQAVLDGKENVGAEVGEGREERARWLEKEKVGSQQLACRLGGTLIVAY